MDFPSIWKTASIAVTGGFAVLGLLTEFKDKETKKITRWGYVSLTGILVSTVLGIAAQVLEIASDAQRSAENSRRALSIAENTERTLKNTDQTIENLRTILTETMMVTQKTDRTLNDAERLLTPLDEPSVTIGYAVPCREQRFQAFCNQLDQWNPVEIQSDPVQGRLFETWPKIHPYSKDPVTVDAYLTIYQNLSHAEDLAGDLFATSNGEDPMGLHSSPAKLTLTRFPVFGNTLWIRDYKLGMEINRGTVTSVRDLKGAFAVVAEFADGEVLLPVYMVIHSKNGILAAAERCQEIKKSALRRPPIGLWPDDDPKRLFQCQLR
jgi:hypothetical protein